MDEQDKEKGKTKVRNRNVKIFTIWCRNNCDICMIFGWNTEKIQMHNIFLG